MKETALDAITDKSWIYILIAGILLSACSLDIQVPESWEKPLSQFSAVLGQSN
jgi:hypothetical protein